ncbi:MAG: hypothetical protein ACRCZI_12025, partial [Cetobacterium sp.]
MNLFNKTSKILKSCCKNKSSLTTAAIVSFLINGTILLGNEYDHVIKTSDKTIYANINYWINVENGKFINEQEGEYLISSNTLVDGSDTTASYLGSYGIAASNGNTVVNTGIITVKNGYAVGMGVVEEAGSSNNGVIKNRGTLNITGFDKSNITKTIGMALNSNSSGINEGTINVTNGTGMIDYSGGNNKVILNSKSGTINVAENAAGIYYRHEKLDDNAVKNEGIINVRGSNSTGVKIENSKGNQYGNENNKNFTNLGTINVFGENTKGISVSSMIKKSNNKNSDIDNNKAI